MQNKNYVVNKMITDIILQFFMSRPHLDATVTLFPLQFLFTTKKTCKVAAHLCLLK